MHMNVRVVLFLVCMLHSFPVMAEDRSVPFRADAGLSVAESYLQNEKYMEAMHVLSDVLKRRPTDADALTYMGYAWMQLEDLQKAGRYLDKALRADPEHLGANTYKAKVYLRAGKPSRAHEQLQVMRMVCVKTDCPEIRDLQSALNTARPKPSPDR